MKKHILISLIGSLFGITMLYYIGINESEVQSNSYIMILLSGIVGIAIGYLFYMISLKLDHVIPWQTQLNKRLFFGMITHYMASFIVVYLTIQCIHIYSYSLENLDQITIKIAIILFILTLIYSVIYFVLYSYYSYTTLQIEIVKNDRKQIDLQLKSLKSQLSPHFLFNNLNTISSLIYKDTNRAESYIRHLSKLYLYTLKSYETKIISLEDELNLVINYLFLLQTRFEDKFQCKIDIPDKIKTSKIPPLTLQMLVENAVKHNLMDSDHPLKIEIYYDGQYIKVRNNITESPKKINSFNIGLKNINKRYLLIFKQGIVIKKNHFFEVQIPVIP